MLVKSLNIPYSILLLTIFWVNNCFSYGLQLGTGGLTPHFGSSKKNYCNQWNNTGVIANKSYYLRLMSEQYAITYMQGNDSICSEIEGLFFHYLFKKTDWYDMGITVGGYAFNEENWFDHAEETPSDIDAPEPVQIDYFGREVVPVLALEVGIHLIKRENWSFKLNNLFTPIIFNHSLALEFRF